MDEDHLSKIPHSGAAAGKHNNEVINPDPFNSCYPQLNGIGYSEVSVSVAGWAGLAEILCSNHVQLRSSCQRRLILIHPWTTPSPDHTPSQPAPPPPTHTSFQAHLGITMLALHAERPREITWVCKCCGWYAGEAQRASAFV